MLVTKEDGFCRASINLGYAKVEFTGKNWKEATEKAMKWLEKNHVR